MVRDAYVMLRASTSLPPVVKAENTLRPLVSEYGRNKFEQHTCCIRRRGVSF
jgi:hypothetical protein